MLFKILHNIAQSKLSSNLWNIWMNIVDFPLVSMKTISISVLLSWLVVVWPNFLLRQCPKLYHHHHHHHSLTHSLTSSSRERRPKVGLLSSNKKKPSTSRSLWRTLSHHWGKALYSGVCSVDKQHDRHKSLCSPVGTLSQVIFLRTGMLASAQDRYVNVRKEGSKRTC